MTGELQFTSAICRLHRVGDAVRAEFYDGRPAVTYSERAGPPRELAGEVERALSDRAHNRAILHRRPHLSGGRGRATSAPPEAVG